MSFLSLNFFPLSPPFSCRASFSEVARNDEWFSVCGSFSVLLTFLLSCLWRKAELIEMRTFLCLFGYLSILPILFVSAPFSFFPPHFPYPLIISFNNPLYSDLSSFPIVLFHSLLFFSFSFFSPRFSLFQSQSANDLHFATNSIDMDITLSSIPLILFLSSSTWWLLFSPRYPFA